MQIPRRCERLFLQNGHFLIDAAENGSFRAAFSSTDVCRDVKRLLGVPELGFMKGYARAITELSGSCPHSLRGQLVCAGLPHARQLALSAQLCAVRELDFAVRDRRLAGARFSFKNSDASLLVTRLDSTNHWEE